MIKQITGLLMYYRNYQMYEHLYEHLNNYLNNLLYGFCKAYAT